MQFPICCINWVNQSLFNNDHHCCCNINIITQKFDSKKERTIMGQSRPSTIPPSSSWSSSGSGGQAAAAPSRGIKFGNWVEELHYTQHPEEVLSQCVCVCVGGVGGTVDETKSSCVLHINISSWLCLFSENFWTIFLLQVDRKKHKGGNMAVGLFNPMRFLHSIETWKKEETEV